MLTHHWKHAIPHLVLKISETLMLCIEKIMRLLVMPRSAARSMDELKTKTDAHTHTMPCVASAGVTTQRRCNALEVSTLFVARMAG